MNLTETKLRHNYLTLTTCQENEALVALLKLHLDRWYPEAEASYKKENGRDEEVLVVSAVASTYEQDGYFRAIILAFYYGYTWSTNRQLEIAPN